MFKTPFDWTQDYTYDTYANLVTRINAFDRVSTFGQDATATYDMYQIELGTSGKPKIYIEASLHGSEWEGTTFSMRFMEMLRDRDFSLMDREFQNELLANFHIIYVPMANPWGYANQIRENPNTVDLNRDFYDFTQVESQNTRDNMLSWEPFAFLDIHLMQQSYNTHELIFGTGDYKHMNIQDEIANTWEMHMNGEPCRRWVPGSDPASGLARMFWARQTSRYIVGTPLSFISEITRDNGTSMYFTRPQIMNAGMAHIYIWLKYVTTFYREFKTEIY